jgi:beta-N-acetylhexosaminidase
MRKAILLVALLASTCSSYAQKANYSKPHEDWTQLFFQPSERLEKAVDSIYDRMSPQQRAAQMIMTASSTATQLGYPFGDAKKLVVSDLAANLVFLKGTATAFKAQAAELNASNKERNLLPPLFACDCEPSLMSSKWNDVPGIIPASQQKNEKMVREQANKINAAMQSVGVQLNFAPVVDIAANAAVINKRSFGNDPKTLRELATTFVEHTQDAGIGATLKHFPGHGAVKGDSHKQSVYIDGALTELENFSTLLHSPQPPVAVMVGHIVVRNNKKYGTEELPATLSPAIIKGLLRQDLGYKGIITTDALNMEAAAKIPDADFKAVEAGVDLILMPKNARLLNYRIVTALNQNDALSKQIQQSVKRIIRYKLLVNGWK